MIPPGKHYIHQKDIQAVVRVLKSDFLTQGQEVPKFEQALAKYCGSKYAVAVSSGTAALHLACISLGLKKNQLLVTSPISFLASANCALYCGARPVFADIDPITMDLNSSQLNTLKSKRLKGIIPVHFGGTPCDMNAIKSFASKRKIWVLEDAAHALGAEYKVNSKWYRVGSCHYSDATIFSFHPLKSITTGEGGAITTNRRDVYERLLLLRSHGMVRDKDRFKNARFAYWQRNGKTTASGWYYEMHDLGFNYRLTDMQAALGLSQLSRLNSHVKRRWAIAQVYNRALKNFPIIQLPEELKNVRSAYHLYVIRLNLNLLSATRAEIFHELRGKGIGVHVHYLPIPLQPYYQKLGFKASNIPNAHHYYERALSLPIYPTMTESQVHAVVQSLKAVLKKHLKK